jgi:hypothetical protein
MRIGTRTSKALTATVPGGLFLCGMGVILEVTERHMRRKKLADRDDFQKISVRRYWMERTGLDSG